MNSFLWREGVLRKRGEKFSDLSRDVRKSCSTNESYHVFFNIKDLKSVAVMYAFL